MDGQGDPLGDCLLLLITVVAHIFGLLFPVGKVMYVLISTKNGLGYILGVFSQTIMVTVYLPIPRLLHLQLQRGRCCRLERFLSIFFLL
jgi:hypothetical protein